MRNLFLLFLLIIPAQNSFCQTAPKKYCELFDHEVNNLVDNSVEAEESSVLLVVNEIMDKAGLAKNFVIRPNSKIDNVRAEVKKIDGEDERIISYNPRFIHGVGATINKWAIYAAFAHEIAHHINGDYLKDGVSTIPKELAADKYSGRILKMLGASIEESRAYMKELGSVNGSASHPSRAKRVAAIEEGWNSVEAPVINRTPPKKQEPDVQEESFPVTNPSTNTSSRANIFVAYSGDYASCTLYLTIKIGDKTFIPTSNYFEVRGVQRGTVNYSISGNISCPWYGQCSVSGSGSVEIEDDIILQIVWSNDTYAHCTVELVDTY